MPDARLSNTQVGKAFEYAFLASLAEAIARFGVQYEIVDDAPYRTAHMSFDTLDSRIQQRYRAAAESGVDLVLPLEPRLLEAGGEQPLLLSIAADSRGEGGDVRDVICSRGGASCSGADDSATAPLFNDAPSWEIGFSCKHNHEALKHPRITESMDFGLDWMGYGCSPEFFSSMAEPMALIREQEGEDACWRDVPDKVERIYEPIIAAFSNEIAAICDAHEDASAKLLQYFFGVRDFYKVIMMESDRYTRVDCFNINGTLQQASKTRRPARKLQRINLPSKLESISRVNDREQYSQTTLFIRFNHNWAISMRLHNADSHVKTTGLKWDVQLIGVPHESVGTIGYWRIDYTI